MEAITPRLQKTILGSNLVTKGKKLNIGLLIYIMDTRNLYRLSHKITFSCLKLYNYVNKLQHSHIVSVSKELGLPSRCSNVNIKWCSFINFVSCRDDSVVIFNNFFTIASPMPVPGNLSLPCRRWKTSKICSLCSFSKPISLFVILIWRDGF